MEEQSILEEVGLNRKEAKLYLILLKKGESSAVSLAKESGLHRRTVYDTLDKLQKKGLINTKIKKFVRYFVPINPENLLNILRERQAIVKRILPELINQFNRSKGETIVNVFEGVEGMKAVLNDTLKKCMEKKDVILMTGAGLRTPGYMRYSFPHYVEQLRRIRWKLIEPDLPRVREDLKKWKVPIKNCRFITARYLAPVGILVYVDRTIIMLLEEEPIMIQIIGKNYAKAFKSYFHLLWKISK